MKSPNYIIFASLILIAGAHGANIEMPAVKYPGAITFEGGSGNNSPFSGSDKKHTSSWRLTLCLQKTDTPITGQVTLDLNKLNFSYETGYGQWNKDGTPISVSFIERLNTVTINYSYTATLVEKAFSDPNVEYAFGHTDFTSTSIQDWSVIYQKPELEHTKHYNDLDIFNFNIPTFETAQGATKSYTINGSPFYISENLDLVLFASDRNLVHIMSACEIADQPTIIQIGEQIPKN